MLAPRGRRPVRRLSASDPLRTLAVTAKLPPMKHLHWLLIVAAPLLLMAGYWLLVHDRSGSMDWMVLALAIAVGLMGIWLAPWRRAAQTAVTVAYVPLMGLALAVCLVAFECSTGNCL